VNKIALILLAGIVASIVFFARWVVRVAADAPGMVDQRPTRSSPGAASPRDRVRLATYSARRSSLAKD
jgi:hypothetical protein